MNKKIFLSGKGGSGTRLIGKILYYMGLNFSVIPNKDLFPLDNLHLNLFFRRNHKIIGNIFEK